MGRSTYNQDKLWELIKQDPWATNKELGEIMGIKPALVNNFKYQHRDEITKWISDNGLTEPADKKRKKKRSVLSRTPEQERDDKLLKLIHDDPTSSNQQLGKLMGMTEAEVQQWRDVHRKEICLVFGDAHYDKRELDVEGNREAMERVLANPTVPEGKNRARVNRKNECREERKKKAMAEEMNGMIEALQDDKQVLTSEIDKLIAERDRLTEENETLKSQLSMMDGELNAERELRLEYARRMESERRLTEIEKLKLIIADMMIEKWGAV